MKKLVFKLVGFYLNVLAWVAPRRAARKGFLLFCRPFRTSMKSYHMNFLDSAEKYVFEHDHHRIQVYKWGTGKKVVLFLHGWQSHSFRWKNYIEALLKEEKYVIYALDAPGHGLSNGNFMTVPLYSTIIEKFIETLSGVHVAVGHSVGAFSALFTVHRLPALPLNGLVLLAMPANATEFIDFYEHTLGLSARSMSLIRDYFRSVIGQPVEFFSTLKFSESLKLPTFLVNDEEEADAPKTNSVNIHVQVPQSKIILTRGTGHNLRSPEVVNNVTEFIKSMDSAVTRV